MLLKNRNRDRIKIIKDNLVILNLIYKLIKNLISKNNLIFKSIQPHLEEVQSKIFLIINNQKLEN